MVIDMGLSNGFFMAFSLLMQGRGSDGEKIVGNMERKIFGKVLVPVDFSPCSEEAYRVALSLARKYLSEVILLHVIDTNALEYLNRQGLALPSQEKDQKKRLRHQARLMARHFLQLENVKGLTIRRVIVEGAPFVEIARAVRKEKVHLVVMGSYGGEVGSVEKIFFGSTAEKVVRTAGCPVLTIPLTKRLSAKKGDSSIL